MGSFIVHNPQPHTPRQHNPGQQTGSQASAPQAAHQTPHFVVNVYELQPMSAHAPTQQPTRLPAPAAANGAPFKLNPKKLRNFAYKAFGVAALGGIAAGAFFGARAIRHAVTAPKPNLAGGPMPPNATISGGYANTSLADASLSSAILFGCAASTYAGVFAVGNQTFNLRVDTGSGDLAVASERCDNCDVLPKYKPGLTSLDLNQSSTSDYAGGTSWEGELFVDKVAALAANLSKVAHVQMAVSAITHDHSQLIYTNDCGVLTQEQASYQGIIGLGQDTAGTNKNNFMSVFPYESSAPAAYTFQGCDVSSQGSGFLTFGGYNPQHLSEAPRFAPMAKNYDWYGVTIADMRIGNTSFLGEYKGIDAAADTGTAELWLPPQAHDAFKAALAPHTGSLHRFNDIYSDCIPLGTTRADLDAILPPLSIDVVTEQGGIMTLTMPASKSYFEPMGSGVGNPTAGSYCMNVASGALYGVPANMTILGVTLMRSYAVVFDVDNQQIGFAPFQGCPATMT